MSDPVQATLTIKDAKIPWQKPESQQYWYSVATEEFGEPIKFIQDRSKGAPAPKIGESYEGRMYDNKFYPNIKKTEQQKLIKDDSFKPIRDVTDMPYRVWKDMLPLMDAQQLVKDEEYNRELNEYVLTQSAELLNMIDKVRTPEESKEPTIHDKLQKGFTPRAVTANEDED